MVNIRSLKQGDHELIGRIIGESFAGDPVNEFLLGPERAIRMYNTIVAKKLYLKHGFGHIAEDLSGGTMWLPPGISTELPWWQSMGVAALLIKYGGLRGLFQGLSAAENIAQHRPKEPFFYLYAIGNVPRAQGKGMGGRLLDAGLKVVDQAAMPAFLECSKESNISFYNRYGFELVSENIVVRGCPPEWLMYRPAKG